MARVVAVVNQKGGVGKTFLVFHLAHFLVERGARVLAVDLDPQGNLTLSFKIREGRVPEDCPAAEIFEEEKLRAEELLPGLFLCGSNIKLARYEAASSGVAIYFKFKKSLKKFFRQKEVDFVLIDCPPSLGLFSLSALVAAHKLIVPLRSEIFSVSGLGDLLNVVSEVKENINPELEIAGLVINALNPRTKVSRETLKELEEAQEIPLLATIPASIKAEEALRAGLPLWQLEPSHKMAGALKKALKDILHSLNDGREIIPNN